MNVTVSVCGRFHAFNLASQLHAAGHLCRLLTSYPVFETAKYGVPREKIESVFIVELAKRMGSFLPRALTSSCDFNFRVKDAFDRIVSKRIPTPTDIYVGWSSNCLHSIRAMKKRGVTAIVERGSSHILFQNRILREECEKLGIRPEDEWKRNTEKELQEYMEADYISIPSSFVKRTFIQNGIPESKLLVNPYGVDLTNFFPAEKHDNVFRIIHAGGIIARKGVHYLLQAFYELDLPQSELWLIGNCGSEMEPFLRKYDNGRIFLKGPYPQNQLARYYSQGSVFCLASIEEGMAMVLLQAMACALPVICTANTGGEDIVRDGIDGYVVPIRDLDALKSRILYLYEHVEVREQMALSARERVKEDSTWVKYGARAIRNYEGVLRRKGAGPA